MIFSEKQYNTNYNFFTLEKVATETWFLVHMIGFYHEEELPTLFNLLKNHFICPKCKKHIKDYLHDHEIKTFKDTLIFHNAVNARLGKLVLNEDLFNEKVIEILYEEKVTFEFMLYLPMLAFFNGEKRLGNKIVKIIFHEDFCFNDFNDFFSYVLDIPQKIYKFKFKDKIKRELV